MPLARVGGEVCAPDLDRDARGGEAALAQPGAASIREADQFRSQLRVVLDVGIEGLLGADLDFLEIGYDGTIVDPRSALSNALGVATEDRPQQLGTRHV